MKQRLQLPLEGCDFKSVNFSQWLVCLSDSASSNVVLWSNNNNSESTTTKWCFRKKNRRLSHSLLCALLGLNQGQFGQISYKTIWRLYLSPKCSANPITVTLIWKWWFENKEYPIRGLYGTFFEKFLFKFPFSHKRFKMGQKMYFYQLYKL